MAEINLRKKKLKDDLDKLESGFQDRVKKVTGFLPGSLNPAESIRKRPFRSVGIAIAAGLIIGLSRGKSRSDSVDRDNPSANVSGRGFSSILIDELKRLAAHRAAHYVSGLIDQKMKGNNRQDSH